MNQTDPLFVPPAAEGLPLAALDSATAGASALDAWARTPQGRNFLAHALVQLARTGWLRTEPGEGFEPVPDRETPEPEPAAVSAVVSPPTDRAAVLLEAADAVAADNHGILYGTASDYAERHAALLRRLAAEAHSAGTQQHDTEAWRCDAGFVFGGRCVKPAGHDDPHVTAPVAQQPAADGDGPRCRYCGSDCTDGRSYDGGGLYACGACSDARAARNRAERQAAAADDEETPEPARDCTCKHPADAHSVYGCEDDCACEWMPRRTTPRP